MVVIGLERSVHRSKTSKQELDTVKRERTSIKLLSSEICYYNVVLKWFHQNCVGISRCHIKARIRKKAWHETASMKSESNAGISKVAQILYIMTSCQ